MNESLDTVTTARVVWLMICLALVAWECYWLGRGVTQATLSYQMRLIRFDAVGRWLVLPLWCWLTLHFITAPKWLGVRPDWRSLVALAIGLAWAAWETMRAAR